jgi:S-layer protein (TIGR01567 family)
MKIKFLIFSFIIIIVAFTGCISSQKPHVLNETKIVTPEPIPTIPEQESIAFNETKPLKINDTFETWSRGYYSNKSYKNSYFKVITNYDDWIAFLDEQVYSMVPQGKRTDNLEGHLFPGLDTNPKIITPTDFNDYFIIAAMMGMRRTAELPEIEIKNIRKINNVVDVIVRKYDPGVGGANISAPYHIVLVKKEQIPESSTFDFIDTQGGLIARFAGYDFSSLEKGQDFDESGENYTVEWNGGNFQGFWHDTETNVSTETIIINQSILNNNHRIIEKHNLVYTTKSVPLKYQVYSHANITPQSNDGFYSAIGWQGEKYVFFQGNRLSRILFEQNVDEAKTMTSGESWKFDEGYRILVNSVDVRTIRQVWFSFFKDDDLIQEAILGDDGVYTYSENSNYSSPIFVTHASNYRSLPESDIVDFNYTWLMSQNQVEIKEQGIFGIMEVTSIKNGTIELRNIVPIDLVPANVINLMGDLNIQVGSSGTDLNFYPFSIRKGGSARFHISSPSLIKTISTSHPILKNNIVMNEIERDYYSGDFSQECSLPCEGNELKLSITGYHKRSGGRANIVITMENAFAQNERLRKIEIIPNNEERIGFKTIASGGLSGYTNPDFLIIKSLSDWSNVWNNHVSYLNNQKPKLLGINFANETVVAVFFGDSPGFDPELIDVTGEGTDIFINMQKRYPSDLSSVQLYVMIGFRKKREI